MSSAPPEPRVLVIAEAANPEWVSVPLVGWSHAQALQRLLGAHVVTQVRNREALERAGWVHGREFTALDSEPVARPAYQLARWLRGGRETGWTTGMAIAALSYPYFERLAWQRFGEEIRGGRWDVVHRLTPLSPTIPSPIARHCRRAGVPFVLGPLNGGVPWPRGFDGARRQEREWLSYVRDAYKLLPGYRATRRSAAALVVGSSDTWAQLAPRYRDKAFYVPENAIDPGRFPEPRQRRAGSPLRAVFVGRLVPYKGADMLIEAAAPLVRSGALEVDVLGDGPQREALEALRRREGVEAGVRLHGWVEHREVGEHLRAADVLAFPSIREFGGGVVLEAMAVGLAPLVVDYGGPGDLVDDTTGLRVPIGDRAAIVAGFRAALEGLLAAPETLDGLGSAARSRVQSEHTWQRRAEQMRSIHVWAMGRGPRPTLPLPATASQPA